MDHNSTTASPIERLFSGMHSMISFRSIIVLGSLLGLTTHATAQSGIRQSLERLDRDQDGMIEPHEITPLARPFLERVAKSQRLSLDRDNSIERWQEATRIYHALQNGVDDRRVRVSDETSVKAFGPSEDEPMVPEFGLPEVKYPYTIEDLEEADRTLRRSDRNRDGYIDRPEADRAVWTHRDPFEMDLNHDDRLSRLELAQRYARRRLLDEAADELRQKSRRTGSEISSRYSQSKEQNDSQWYRRGGTRYYLAATVLSRFDLNKNGRLEMQETTQLGIPPGKIDANRDGELDRDELQAYFGQLQDQVGDLDDGLPGWFFELDADRDQQVSMAEFASEWTDEKLREFESLDFNQDGLLTAAEVMSSKAMTGGSYSNEEAEILPPRKTVISEIVVDDDFLIGDLNVQLSLTHTFMSHLDAYLTGPDGQRVELFAGVGGSDDHMDRTTFDDQSRFPINKARPPFRGTFMPMAMLKRQPSLSQFNGTNIKGVWQLVIRCSRSDRFGMLHRWALLVRPLDDMLDQPASPPTDDGPQPSENASPPLRLDNQPRASATGLGDGGSPTRAFTTSRLSMPQQVSPERPKPEAIVQKKRDFEDAYNKYLESMKRKGDRGKDSQPMSAKEFWLRKFGKK